MGDADQISRVKRGVFTYLVLTVAISTLGYAGTILSGETSIILLVAPAIAAVVTRLIFQRNLRGFGFELPSLKTTSLAYALPLLITGGAFLVAWGVFGLFIENAEHVTLSSSFLRTATLGVLLAALFGFGEELGWRGYLVPELAKITSFRNLVLISGTCWALWHWPLILFAAEVTDFDKAPLGFTLAAFSGIILAASVILAWITLKSGSVWPAVVLHGSQNAFSQGFFSTHTDQAGVGVFLASEIGVLVFGCWAFAAIVVYRSVSSSNLATTGPMS